MKNIFQVKKIMLFVGDLIVLYFSLYSTLFLRYFEKPEFNFWNSHFSPFTTLFIFWIIIFYIANLYNLHLMINNAKFFQMTNRALIIAFIVAIAFFYLNPNIDISPKTTLAIYIIIFYFLFFLWRLSFNILLKSYLPKKNIIIIGINELTKELIKELNEKPHLGYNIPFVIDEKKEEFSQEINNIKIFSNIKEIKQKIINHKISLIVLTSNIYETDELRSILFECLPFKISFISLTAFYENITGKVPIETINQIWFLENLNEGNKNIFDIFKRIFDIFLAFFIGIITLPFWLIIALIIKLESKGPVFFKQIRSGKNNIPFTLIKFRTMKEEGNDRSLTILNDKRITRIGLFLRKTRIDELPQIFNIIKGEMSFVGPRPERPEFIIELEKQIPFYKERMLVKPGLTGWDQISGEYHSPTAEDSIKKLQYDLYYIKNRSFYLDLSIILKTTTTILSKSGI